MRIRHWVAAIAMTVFVATGCETHDRDMQKFNQDDPRYNREAAPPTGLKQNPARPKSYYPETEP